MELYNKLLLKLAPGTLAAFRPRNGERLWRSHYHDESRSLAVMLRQSLRQASCYDREASVETGATARDGHAHRYDYLIDVAANYGALTARHPYSVDSVHFSYALFILAGWIWDDIADLNKHTGDIKAALRVSYLCVDKAINCSDERAWTRDEIAAAAVPASFAGGVTTIHNLECMSAEVMTRMSPYFAQRARATRTEFYKKFVEKVGLTHSGNVSFDEYVATRKFVVGMLPSFEPSYALKAQLYGVGEGAAERFFETHADLIDACAMRATLHCAAVNDIFSVHKDRIEEDTMNFPAVFSGDRSDVAYLGGALRTIQYLSGLVDQYEELRGALGRSTMATVVGETLQHMMEGNLLFHLTVPRYGKGVEMVRALVDANLSFEGKKRVFLGLLRDGNRSLQATASAGP